MATNTFQTNPNMTSSYDPKSTALTFSFPNQNTTTNIPVSQVTPTQPFNIQNTVVTPADNGMGLVTDALTGANNFQADYQKYLDMNATPQNNQLDQLIQSLGVNPLEGKGQAQIQAEQQAGIQDIQKQRSNIAGQIATKTAAYNKLNADLEAGTRGAGQTDIRASMLFGQQGAVNRQAAAEIGLLQAQEAALAGNEASAQNAVNRAIDLMYSDKEAEYQTKLQQYNLIKDKLAGEDAKRGKALEYALNREEKQLADQKQNAKDIEGLKVKILENGGDPNTITATNYSEALNQAKGALMKKNIDVKEINGALYAVTTSPDGKVQIKSLGVGGSGTDKLYSGLSSTQSTAVRGLATKFSSEPVVTGFSTIQEGRNFANSLSNKTTNPADDQGLIYALAKALDPNSVVREGEYATAQKYSQSWVNAYGKGITQAIAGTGFLSEAARTNIKKTIESKYNASKGSYDNLKNSYSTGISKITGKQDGKDYLREYEIGIQEEMPKGTMSDRDYVEKVLSSNNIKYDEFVNTTPQGQIPVIDNSTGQIGYIPYTEFNSSKYTKI